MASVVLAAAALAGCSSEGDQPDDAPESLAASPTESDSPTAEVSTSPTGSPAPTAGSPTPAPAEESTSTPPPSDQGCDPDVFTPQARVDVRRSATQLLGFERTSVGPGTGVLAAERVELFEALFSGVVDQDGAEVTGPLRSAVVERLGAGVVRDGVEELRVPVRLRNESDQERQYVVYAFATRREGSWTATACPEGVADRGPTEVRGTFAAWQRLDHGVVECGTDPEQLSRVGQDAQLNGCGRPC
jgi:hypothetical protein